MLESIKDTSFDKIKVVFESDFSKSRKIEYY